MATPQDKGAAHGENAASNLGSGIKGIFGKTEELRTGINSFFDHTLQPSAKKDADAGVTSRHKDDDYPHHTNPEPAATGTGTTTTTGTTGTTTSSAADPAVGTEYGTTPGATSSIAAHNSEDPAVGDRKPGVDQTLPTQAAGTGSAGFTGSSGSQEQAKGHTGFSGDAKKLGDSIKHAFDGMRKH